MNIADIQSSVTLFLETGQFEADAAKAGESAGATVGASMSGKIKASLGGMALAGVGLEIGKQIVGGLESAFSKIADIIPGMFQSGQAFAMNVQDITKATGASAETASRFAGTLTYLGQSTSGLGQMLKTLSVQVVSNEAQFKKLGIETRDSNGNLLDTITILNNVRSYLSTAGDGATKLTLATHLLGRSAGNLIEYLDLTDAQAAKLNETMDALGVTISEKAVQSAEGAARETNLLSLAWQGFSNILMTEVAPTVRQVLGAAFQFIVDHGAEVRQTLIDITNAALGLISGLLGIEGVTPFQSQLDSLGGSASNVTLSFDQWAQQNNYIVPKIDKTAAATKAASAAIAAATKAIDAQVASLKVLDTVQAKTYKDGLAGLNSQLDAQLKLMSAQDQANQRAATAAGLQRSLRDAQEALTKAQLDAQTAIAAAQADKTLSPLARAQAELDAANSVRNAEEALAQVRQSIADNARTTTEDDRKAQIQGVKDYITAIDTIVSDAGLAGGSTKTALADLEKQRKGLGKPAAGSDQSIELQAVLAAEKRIRQQALSTTKQDALTAKKDQLSQEAAAQSSADSAKVTADKATLKTLNALYKAYTLEQEHLNQDSVARMVYQVAGNPKTGTGLGGAFTKSFTDAQAAGESFKAWIDTKLIPSLRTILDVMDQIASALGSQGLTMAGGAAVGLKLGGLPGLIVGGAAGGIVAAKPGTVLTDPGGPLQGLLQLYDQVFGTHYSTTGTRATGGPVSSGMPYLVGERGPELFVPSTNGAVEPSGSFGGQPAIIRLEIGGRPLLDYVDQNLAYRRTRRT